MKKVYIGTDRPIGERCKAWARDNMPAGFELTDDINDCDVFISVLYAKLLTQEYIMGRRCYNFHPGILPKYRGSGAFSWVFINQDDEAGITLHELDHDLDHGSIIAIDRFPIEQVDTAWSLFKKGEDAIFALFVRWFQCIVRGDYYKAKPQDEGKAQLYYRKQLELAKDLTRYVKAFTFEGKENAYYYNRKGEKIYLEW